MPFRTITLSLLYLLLALPLLAQVKTIGVTTIFKNEGEGQRKALVLGNKSYTSEKPLQNTLRDADSMAVALRYLGFAVTLVQDKNRSDTQDAIDLFVASLRPDDVAFIYYSGHGVGYSGSNYLLPIDFDARCTSQIANRAISIEVLTENIRVRGVRNLLMVVDACRNLTLGERCPDGKGTGAPATELIPTKTNTNGMLVAFATDYGKIASERGKQNRNSLYTESLLLYLCQPLELIDIFERAGNRTYEESVKFHQQNNDYPIHEPVYTKKLYGKYYFLKPRPEVPPPPPPRDTVFVFRPEPAKPDRLVPTLPATPQKFLDLPFADMVYVPGGTFQMGDTRGEGGSDEKPVHQVTVSSFLMGKHEVTQRQWENVMGSNPSHFKDCPDCPVETVSWDDVQVFLTKLNARTGGRYRLPTEAEWEYAAGGGSGSRSRFGTGTDVLSPSEANFDGREGNKKSYSVAGDYRRKTVRVGSLKANVGLHDLSGNVWEWCTDWYGPYSSSNSLMSTATPDTGPNTGQYRVLRGGSWSFTPRLCRVANRHSFTPTNRDDNIGFRLVSQAQ